MNIIPKPKYEKQNPGYFPFPCALEIDSAIDGVDYIISRFLGMSNAENPGSEQKVSVDYSPDFKEEAYSLNVFTDEIRITACSLKGVFYAVQTLAQLSGSAAGKPHSIPCCEILDEPRFAYRGFMLDEARHFRGKEFVKKTLDMMALIKLNVFHWHLTDDQGWRIEIKKYPLLTQKGAVRKSTQLNTDGYDDFKEKRDNTPYGEGLYYTQDDIKEIVDYAAKRNIEVIPEIDMPGHLTAAAACYPELTCTKEPLEVSDRWGVMETIGCAGSEELYTFVFDVIDELAGLFPSRYFHIGGDEVPKARWKACPKCQAKIKELHLKDEEELQCAFNARVQTHLKKNGKSVIGWNEILKGSPTPDTVIQYWIGDCEQNGVKEWIESGNTVILTPNDFVYMDHFYSMQDLRTFYSMDYDTLGLPSACQDCILGVEAPMWTEYARDIGKFNFNVYPRLQAIAEIAWTPKAFRDFDDFNHRVKAFREIYQQFGIVPASEKYYLCEGEEGEKRRQSRTSDWVSDPNTEYNRFLNEDA